MLQTQVRLVVKPGVTWFGCMQHKQGTSLRDTALGDRVTLLEGSEDHRGPSVMMG